VVAKKMELEFMLCVFTQERATNEVSSRAGARELGDGWRAALTPRRRLRTTHPRRSLALARDDKLRTAIPAQPTFSSVT
jgi:hypothetical protein